MKRGLWITCPHVIRLISHFVRKGPQTGKSEGKRVCVKGAPGAEDCVFCSDKSNDFHLINSIKKCMVTFSR